MMFGLMEKAIEVFLKKIRNPRYPPTAFESLN